MEAVNFVALVKWDGLLQRMMASLGLGPAVVLVESAALLVLHFVGSDLHILGENLLESLKLGHMFGLGVECGGVGESGEGGS